MDYLNIFDGLGEPNVSLEARDVDLLDKLFVRKDYETGHRLCSQGEEVHNEYLLIHGRARGLVVDAEGREVCLGFYVSPCVISPHIARTRQGVSLIDIEVLGDSQIGVADAQSLLGLMVENENIREWGNAIMRYELSQKVDRELCLASLDAAERLAWFRTKYPDYEKVFIHAHIASHLGMTPVTLSRLRRKD